MADQQGPWLQYQGRQIPAPPPGFSVDTPQPAWKSAPEVASTQGALPPLPPGYTLDKPRPAWMSAPEVHGPWDNYAAPAAHPVRRQVELTARDIGEGVADTLALPQSIGIGLQNQLRKAVNKVFGTKLPMQESWAQGLSQALTKSGAPVATTPGEQLGSAVTRGAVGALTGAGVLGAAGSVANLLRAGASGATAGGSQEVARQMGLPGSVQTLAGLAGGLVPGAGEVALGGIGRAVRPLLRSGQRQIAANVLSRQATNSPEAAANLAAATRAVPNSARTSGEASQDLGILTLEKGLRGKNSAPFGERLSAQNVARQNALSRLAGTPADIKTAEAARDAATAPMRTAAFSKAEPAPVQAVHQKIDELLASPAGARQSVATTLKWAKDQIGQETNPERLYEVRKDLQLAQRGKLQPSSDKAPNASTLAQARGQLGEVVNSLDDAIEAAAPGFKAYLARYRDMSVPISQQKAVQEIQKRSQLSSFDVTSGQQFLGNSAFQKALEKAVADKSLNADQLKQLNAIRTDLNYGAAISSPLVKAPGSDTFQNLSIAQVLGSGRTALHPALKALSAPMGWVYRAAGSDEGVTDILTQAMLDPKLASQLLQRATPASMVKFSQALRQRLAVAGAGSAVSRHQ